MLIRVVSDVHFAGPGERQRRGYEAAAIRHPVLRWGARMYRHHIWLRDPFAHNALLDCFCAARPPADLVVANGDYSCDSAFIGVADDAAAESARECLDRLRACFGDRLAATIGDHELGKVSLFGGQGGLRMASWRRATRELGLEPFWERELGSITVLGLTSSLLALPVYAPEIPEVEREAWNDLREGYLAGVRAAFGRLGRGRRLVLFLHDPTALPFLAELGEVRARLSQVEATVIGHLHSPFILWKSRLLAGLPSIRWLGNAARRMSEALHRARDWRPFRVHLCPSLAGLELFKDGGYLELLDRDAGPGRLRVVRHRLPREAGGAAEHTRG